MACGTGKSLVALWAAEQHGCKNLLVLVPSLALVRQLLHEWLKETAWEQLTFMCVCSDPTVTKGADDLIVHQADLDFPVTTESAAVSRFLSKPFDGVRIVFSTYQSAQVVTDGMPVGADGMAQPFDLAVLTKPTKPPARKEPASASRWQIPTCRSASGCSLPPLHVITTPARKTRKATTRWSTRWTSRKFMVQLFTP